MDASHRLRQLLQSNEQGVTYLSLALKTDVTKADWDEGAHPRGAGGRFGSGDSEQPESKNASGDGSPRIVNMGGVQSMIVEPVPALAAEIGKRDYSTIEAIPREQMVKLAAAYDSAPKDDLAAHESYKAMTEEVKQQYEMLTGKLGIKVDFVSEDPYKDVSELRKDLVENGHLAVLKTDTTVGSSGAHPYFTNEQNDQFRAVHDAFGHAASGRGFDRNGEEAAYQAHRSMFSDKAAAALATETRSQNSYLITRGEFPDQKVALMPAELTKRLRDLIAKATTGITADDDNLYSKGKSHHVSMGRHF